MKSGPLKYLVCIWLCCASHDVFAQVREVPDSVAGTMKKHETFKYANDPSFWENEKPGGNSAIVKIFVALLESPVMRWILYLLLASTVVYMIYQVIMVNDFFTRSGKLRKKGVQNTGNNEVPEEADEKISAAIAARQYRLAIRYYYLKTLGLLSAGNKIQLHAKSTNNDYVQQMRNQSNGSDFGSLTRIYEYVWYGEFQPDEAQFEMIRSGFNQFNERI